MNKKSAEFFSNTLKILVIFVFPINIVIMFFLSFLDPIARKIGFRNIFRRMGNTFLVVLGSMIGAALISGSLVLSDSLDKTFSNLVRTDLGEVDAILQPKEKIETNTGFSFFTVEEADLLENILTNDTDGYLPLWNFSVSPRKVTDDNSGLTLYNVEIRGLDKSGADNFGENPQSIIVPEVGSMEIILSESLAERFEAQKGDKISVPFGSIVSEFTIADIIKDEGIIGGSVMLANIEDVRNVFSLPSDSYNTIFVSALGGIEPQDYSGKEFKDKLDEQIKKYDNSRITFTVNEIKQEALDGFGFQSFVTIFYVMSIFGIFSGILLIVNIYFMLAQERKYEMGIMRAIAFTKFQLVKSFIIEGFFYSIISSFVGAIFGVLVGFVLVTSISSIISSVTSAFGGGGGLEIQFGVQASSILIAFLIGSLITYLTTIYTSYFISNLNIVSAIRDQDDRSVPKITLKWILLTVLNLGLLGYSVLTFFNSFLVKQSFDQIRDQENSPFAALNDADYDTLVLRVRSYLFYIGAMMIILFATLLINRIYFVIKKRSIARITITIGAASAIVFSTLATRFDFFADALNRSEDPVLFFMMGIVTVVAAALFISKNLDILGKILNFILYPFQKIASVVNISLRYPAENSLRTGITLVMFAVIIYMIVYISFNKSLAQESIAIASERALGGFDLLVFPSNENKMSDIENIKTEVSDVDGVRDVSQITNVPIVFPEIKYEDLKEREYFGNPADQPIYNDEDFYFNFLNGLDSEFISKIDIELTERSDDYETDKEVFEAIRDDRTKVLLGSSFISEFGGKRPDLKVGDKIVISDQFQKNTYEREVIGILEAELYGGVLTNLEFINEDFDSEYISNFSNSQVLVSVDQNDNIEDIKNDVRRKLNDYNILIILDIDELIGTALNLINSIILLIQAFLGLSLIIGASGLAIIMSRSVQERRQQIGMLRSLGFQRWMVLLSFFIESTFITLLGIIIGISMGFLGSYSIFQIVQDQFGGIDFIIPWGEISIIVVLIYLASLIFSLYPSLKAARLSPVEATNYPE
ncbi:MAG TPA: FtsX-like permease family protein [Candidatus Dojkabacteria bacterium]